ncbi:MAG: hypothetical protein WBO97_11125, partial [Tepidiformaceae bacterium]
TWIVQNQPCGVLGTGGLIIEKYLDLNGDGDANDAGEGLLNGFSFTTTGGGIPAGNQVRVTGAGGFPAGKILEYISGFNAGDVITTTETQQGGYTLTGVNIDGISQATNLTQNVSIIGGETRVVRFYNQPLGGISVHKDTYNVLDGKETQNLNDDDGWKITLKSVACGVNTSALTDASGNATFTGLKLCNDYVVAEDLSAPGAPGYSPVTPASVSNVSPTINGFTAIKFVNETRKTTPPCPDCNGTTPTPTPVTPTQTPTSPTATPTGPTATPTNPANTATPVPPTNTPEASPTTPVTNIAGEKTPGPGQTPVAPSTGNGLMGGGAAGMNLLFLLAGLVAAAIGSGFLALGRKR